MVFADKVKATAIAIANAQMVQYVNLTVGGELITAELVNQSLFYFRIYTKFIFSFLKKCYIDFHQHNQFQVQTQLIILGLLGETGLSAQCNVGVMEPKNDLGIATHPVMEAIPARLRCNLMTKRVTTDHAPVDKRLLYYIF